MHPSVTHPTLKSLVTNRSLALSRALVLSSALAACAHAQHPTADLHPPVVTATAAEPSPVPAPPAPVENAPVTVGFLLDAAMSHLRVGLAIWHGGQLDPHVTDGGRYLAPCDEGFYTREMHHPPAAPVVLALGCDGRPVAPDTLPVVLEAVRETTAVVLRTATVRNGHPEAWQETARVPVPAGVPVTAAPPEAIAAAAAQASW